MTTITEKLAEALAIAADALAPYMDYCSEGGQNAAMRAHTQARTTLAEYESAGRPLERGDRVRVWGGAYQSAPYAHGAELVVIEAQERLVQCISESPDNTHAGGLSYLPRSLGRIA